MNNIWCSPGSQPTTKYRTGKKSKYRRYQLIFNANIGGLKENSRRFINFEGQLRRFPDFWNLISSQICSLKTVFWTYIPQRKALLASHYSQTKYSMYGPKIGLLYIDYRTFFWSPVTNIGMKICLYLSQDRGEAEDLWQT